MELVDGERKKIDKDTAATVISANNHPFMKFKQISSYLQIFKGTSIWLNLKKLLRKQHILPEEDLRSATDPKEAETYLLLFIQEDFQREPNDWNSSIPL